jgi:hypothetical protein
MTKVRFDEQIAARYDESSGHMSRPEAVDPAVDFLAQLAGDGAALEFGVGTGRIALPLGQRGVPDLRRLPPGERVRAFDLDARTLPLTSRSGRSLRSPDGRSRYTRCAMTTSEGTAKGATRPS